MGLLRPRTITAGVDNGDGTKRQEGILVLHARDFNECKWSSMAHVDKRGGGRGISTAFSIPARTAEIIAARCLASAKNRSTWQPGDDNAADLYSLCI